MHYVGVDLHKEQSWFYVMDNKGAKVLSKSIANKPDILKSFFSAIPTPFTLAVEATYNWYFFVGKGFLKQNRSGDVLRLGQNRWVFCL